MWRTVAVPGPPGRRAGVPAFRRPEAPAPRAFERRNGKPTTNVPAPGCRGRAASTDGYAVGRSTGSGAVEAHLLWVQEVGVQIPPPRRCGRWTGGWSTRSSVATVAGTAGVAQW